MRIYRIFSPLTLMLISSLSAFAQTTISKPTNNEQVSSPFTLDMSASSCSSKPVTAVGYSLDNSSSTSSWNAQSIDGPVGAPSGWHTLHVKVWNESGGVCVTDVTVDVDEAGASATSSGALAVVPSNETKVSSIQTLDNWVGTHDGGTSGSSSGTMSMSGSPSLTGSARLFANQFNNYGGERYSVHFSDDENATGFLYDTWVYIANNSTGFSNLEFDLEQTMANGQTVVMGFQCDTWAGRWDYTVNTGSATKPNDTWSHSSAPCNVHSWAVNKWHHVQIYFTHNDSGWVTYNAVWLDGTQQWLNVTAFSGFALGWGPSLLTNFQIDGASSGTTWGNVYMDELTVYRW
jgi:hypothetical protein